MSGSVRSTRPQVLLIDLPEDCGTRLGKLGLNVQSGTFGVPYDVQMGDGWVPVIASPSLPGASETDIVVIDLTPPRAADGPVGEKTVSEGTADWWASAKYGYVDPRPKVMQGFIDYSRTILQSGGGIIIFADPGVRQEFAWGDAAALHFGRGSRIHADNWSFLPETVERTLTVRGETGQQMTLQADDNLGSTLGRYLPGSRFTCWFEHQDGHRTRWVDLAENKRRQTVAALGFWQEDDVVSFVLLLPQIADKAGLLHDLFDDVLPDLFPALFPDAKELQWTQRPEYEQAAVLSVRADIERVREEGERTQRELAGNLERTRRQYWYLDDILTGTDDKLVKAVAECLRVLGFQDVTECDAEFEREGGFLNEDLRIDGSPLLLIEVKGIGGLPADEEALQAWKYLAPRMRELGRTDIRALGIINHQRHLPPLERNNDSPFREAIIENANRHGFGLLTTWDLYRLTRGFIENGWRHEHVRDAIYRHGRIEPVPTHYQCLGTIADGAVFEDGRLVGFNTLLNLSVGDPIAFELPTRFREQTVTSMHVDRRAVEAATVGQEVCVETVLTKDEARKGLRVFRVSGEETDGGE